MTRVSLSYYRSSAGLCWMDVGFELNFNLDPVSMLFDGKLVVLYVGINIFEVFMDPVSESENLASHILESLLVLGYLIGPYSQDWLLFGS